MKIPFFSAAYSGRSTNFESSRHINFFAEVSPDPNNARTPIALFGTMGAEVWASVGSSPIRGMWVFNEVLYIVSGAGLYGITPGIVPRIAPQVSSVLGTLKTSTGRVRMVDNGVAAYGVGGNQLMIIDGAYGYIYNAVTKVFTVLGSLSGIQATATLSAPNSTDPKVLALTKGGSGYTQVPTALVYGPNGSAVLNVTLTAGVVTAIAFQNTVDASFNYGTGVQVIIDIPSGSQFPVSPTGLTYADGYFLVTSRSMQHHCSNLYDGLSWNPLATGVVAATNDFIQGVVTAHQQVWFIKSNSSEVWYDTGTFTGLGSPFARLSGAVVDFGTPAPHSLTVADNSFFFLASQRTSGGAVFVGPVECNGYTPTPIAPPAIVYQMSRWKGIADAFSYSFSEAGHTFVVFTSPLDDQTFVYDASTTLWHEWSSYQPGPYKVGRHFSNVYARFAGFHLVGDYASGNISILSSDYTAENGNPIVSQQISPIISDRVSYAKVFVERLVVALEAGTEPQLGWSFDEFIVDDAGQSVVDVIGDALAAIGAGEEGGKRPAATATLAWSNDGGHTWSKEYPAAMGPTGAYNTRLVWRRLGYGRDKVFRVTISSQARRVLLDAYMEV